MKSTYNSFKVSLKIYFRVDSAKWSAMFPGSVSEGCFNDGPTTSPMEIGNVESRSTMKRRGFNPSRKGFHPQRMKEMNDNACIKCQKVGWRPWKHAEVSVNHTEDNNCHEAEEEHLTDEIVC